MGTCGNPCRNAASEGARKGPLPVGGRDDGHGAAAGRGALPGAQEDAGVLRGRLSGGEPQGLGDHQPLLPELGLPTGPLPAARGLLGGLGLPGGDPRGQHLSVPPCWPTALL